MKLLIISDIHGNYSALEAVMNDPEAKSCDRIYSLGDHTGFGPSPLHVQECLEAHHAVILQGNHEERLLQVHKPSFQTYGWGILQETAKQLRGKQIQFPVSHEFGPFLMIHGTPADPFRLVSAHELPPILEGLPKEKTVLLTGHNHVSWHVMHQDRTAINFGSLGMTEDRLGQNAPFGIINIRKNNIEITRRSVTYDLRRTIKAYLDSGIAEIMPQLSYAALLTMRTGAPWYILRLVAYMNGIAKEMHLEPGSREAWEAADRKWNWPETGTSRDHWKKEALML